MKIPLIVVLCLGALASSAVLADDSDSVAGSTGIQQSGQASIKAVRTQGGCLDTRAENVQFEPVKIWLRRGESQSLILRVTTDQHLLDCAEGGQGTVTVEATSFDHDLKQATKLWSFTSKGWDGTAQPEEASNLFRVKSPGCCGASDTSGYFSLVNGKPLFKSTVPILVLRVPNSDIERYVGLVDNDAADGSGFTKDGDVIAILSYGSDRDAPQRLLIHTKKGEYYHAGDLSLVVDGKKSTDKTIDLWKADSAKDPKAITGITIHGELSCECDRGEVSFDVPVVDGRLRADLAKAGDPVLKFSAGAGP